MVAGIKKEKSSKKEQYPIKRGDIYYIRDTHKSLGSEQKGDRPAVIISNNKNNTFSHVLEVVYITTQSKHDLPTHFLTTATSKISTVLCEQIDSVDKKRLGSYIGTLPEDEIVLLDQCLAISIDLEDCSFWQQEAFYTYSQNKKLEKQLKIYKDLYEWVLNRYFKEE